MKGSISSYLFLLLIVVSCKQTNEKQSEVMPETNRVEAENNDTTSGFDGTNCFSSDKIYGETAYIWQASWVNYYNSYQDLSVTNSPEIKFGSGKMANLYEEALGYNVPSNEMGVIITYVMIDGQQDPFPYLAIQNIINCSPVEDGLIYYKSPTKLLTEYDANDLNSLKQNWLNFLDPELVFSVAEAYTYSWEALMSEGNNATESGIAVNYGLRTLGPSETEDFPTYAEVQESSGGTTEGKTGSVVYCNVLYFQGDESQAGSDGENMALLDFAKPCPIYCD